MTDYTLSEKELQVIDAGMIKDPRYSDFERIKTEVLAKKKENGGKTLIKVLFDYAEKTNPPINHYRYFFEGDEIPAATATAEYTLSEKELQVIDAAMAPSKRSYDSDEHFAADREKIKTEVLAEKKKNGGKTLIKVELDEIKGDESVIIIIDRGIVRCFFDGEDTISIIISRATATASSEYTLSEKELQVIDAGMIKDPRYSDFERIKTEVLAKKKENCGKTLIKVEFDYKDNMNPPINHYRYTFE